MHIRQSIRGFVAAGFLLITTAAVAQPTDTPFGGDTRVTLAASFLGALESLGVTPGFVSPGRVYVRGGVTYAAFPITTGAVDIGNVTGEIDHAGGISLKAGKTTVELTAFAIDLYPREAPVLTGLVTVNGKFVGRLTLFDLGLGGANVAVDSDEDRLTVKNVSLTLDPSAASALSGIFNTTVPSLPVGTARIKTFLSGESRGW